MPCITKGSFGCCLVAIAVGLTVVGLYGALFIELALQHGIRDIVVVTGPESNGYDGFVDTENMGVIRHFNCYMHHLTNPEEVKTGVDIPRYEEVGPFVWRKHEVKWDPQFSEDQTSVEYGVFTEYTWMEDMGGLDPFSVEITNINPGFIGAVTLAERESMIPHALIGPALRVIWERFMWEEFPAYVYSIDTPSMWGAKLTQLADPMGLEAFAEIWANATSAPSSAWKGVYLAPANGGAPSGFSMEVALKLIGPGSYSLQDESDAAVQAWALAGLGRSDGLDTLVSNTGLSPSAISLVAKWRATVFQPIAVIPGVAAKFDDVSATEPSDLSFRHFGTGDVIEGSVYDRWGAKYDIPDVFEYAVYLPKATPKISTPNARKFLAGPYGIFDPEKLALMADALKGRNWAELKDKWGIRKRDLPGLAAFMLHVEKTIGTPFMEEALDAGGTILTTRTAQEWFFDAQDPLVTLLAGDRKGAIGLLNNCTADDLDRCWESGWMNPHLRVATGKNGMDSAGQVMEVNQDTVIRDWPVDVRVEGSNLDGFPFPVDRKHRMKIHVPEMRRVMEMEYQNDVEISGVTLTRWGMPPDLMLPNPDFNTEIEGFANLTIQAEGVPVLLSAPHFLGGDPVYAEKVAGLNPDPEKHLTYLDVEPITGRSMNAYQALGFNIIVYDDPNHEQYNLWNQDFVKDTIFPLGWCGLVAELPEDLAAEVTGKVYTARQLEALSREVAVPAAAVLYVLGMTCIIRHRWVGSGAAAATKGPSVSARHIGWGHSSRSISPGRDEREGYTLLPDDPTTDDSFGNGGSLRRGDPRTARSLGPLLSRYARPDTAFPTVKTGKGGHKGSLRGHPQSSEEAATAAILSRHSSARGSSARPSGAGSQRRSTAMAPTTVALMAPVNESRSSRRASRRRTASGRRSSWSRRPSNRSTSTVESSDSSSSIPSSPISPRAQSSSGRGRVRPRLSDVFGPRE